MTLTNKRVLAHSLAGLSVLYLLFISACSMPPTRKVSMLEFKKLKLSSFFILENKPEQILEELNKNGEVILPARAKNRSRDPYYIRILATPSGPVVSRFPMD